MTTYLTSTGVTTIEAVKHTLAGHTGAKTVWRSDDHDNVTWMVSTNADGHVTATEQLVQQASTTSTALGDEECRGLVHGGGKYWNGIRDFAMMMGEDVPYVLCNWTDKVSGLLADKLVDGGLSMSTVGYLDLGKAVFNTDGSPPTQQNRFVHFSDMSNGRLSHSGDKRSLQHNDDGRLGQLVHTTGFIGDRPMAVVFTSYSSSKLSDFGVAIYFVYDPRRGVVYYWPLYNRPEDVGTCATQQHAFTYVPERDENGRFTGTYCLCPHPPEEGVTTVKGERFPGIKTSSPDYAHLHERVQMVMVAHYEQCEEERVRLLAVQQEEEDASDARVVTPTQAAEQPPCVSPTSSSSHTTTAAATVQLMVLTDAAQRKWAQDHQLGVTAEEKDEVCTLWMGKEQIGTANTVVSDSEPFRVASLVLALTPTGEPRWTDMPMLGCSTSVVVPRAQRTVVVLSETAMADVARGDWIRTKLRVTDGLIVMVPTPEHQASYISYSDDTSHSGDEGAFDLMKSMSLNPVVLMGGGSMLVVEVTPGCYRRVYGVFPGDTNDVPPTGADVTPQVEAYLRGDEEYPTASPTASPTALVEGGMCVRDSNGAVVSMLMAVNRLAKMTAAELKANLPFVHRTAAMVELASSMDKRDFEKRVSVGCAGGGAGGDALSQVSAKLRELWASTEGNPTVFQQQGADLIAQRKELTAQQSARKTLLNRHFFGRMKEGASVGRVDRRAAQNARTAELTGVKERNDLEEYHARMMGGDEDEQERTVVLALVMRPEGCRSLLRAGMQKDSASKMQMVQMGPLELFCADHRNNPYELLDGELASTLMEVTQDKDHAISDGKMMLAYPSSCHAMVGVADTVQSVLGLPLPAYLEDGVGVDTFDYSPQTLVVSNEPAAFHRQAMRDMVTRLGGRGGPHPHPSDRGVGWMLVMLYLTALERLPVPNEVSAVDASDVLPTVRRRLLVALSHVLGSGQTQMSGLANLFASRRATPYPLEAHEWHVLNRLVRMIPGSGWDVDTVATRYKAFVMRYVNARVLRPVALGWEKSEQNDSVLTADAHHAKVELWQSDASQERKLRVLRQRFEGKPVSDADVAYVCEALDTNRKKRGLLWALVKTPEAIGDDEFSGVRACVGKVGNTSSVTVADAVAFYMTRTLAKELRDVVCSRCSDEQWATLREDEALVGVLSRFLGRKAMERLCVPDKDDPSKMEPATPEELAVAAQTPDTALMVEAGPLVKVLRGWGFPCRHWYVDWTTTDQTDSSSASPSDPQANSTGTNYDSDPDLTPPKKVWTMADILARARRGGATSSAIQAVETILNEAMSADTSVSTTSVLAGQQQQTPGRVLLCRQLLMSAEDGGRLMEAVGWTDAQMGRALRAGVMGMVEGCEGGELEGVMLGVE